MQSNLFLNNKSDDVIKKNKLTDSQFGFLLVLPALIVFSLIVLYPFLSSVSHSFFKAGMLTTEKSFIGLNNFKSILSDSNFTKILINTFIFVFGTTFLSFILGFIWAIILNQGFKGSEFLRGITLVNWIIPGTAIGFLWMWIFHGQFGVLNYILRSLGIIKENITWLADPKFSMLAVIIARTWQYMPWFMALLIGGLKGISNDMVEAARIDGANNFKVFTKIVLPSMKNIIFFILLLGIIAGLQHFDIIWVMTTGGPGISTTTLSVEVYKTAFQNWNLGRASAMGTIWVAILSVFMFLYLKMQREK